MELALIAFAACAIASPITERQRQPPVDKCAANWEAVLFWQGLEFGHMITWVRSNSSLDATRLWSAAKNNNNPSGIPFTLNSKTNLTVEGWDSGKNPWVNWNGNYYLSCFETLGGVEYSDGSRTFLGESLYHCCPQ
jgi:hypothetical protein